MERRIAVIGGDLRQVYLTQMFLDEGQDVVTWGLEKGGGQRPVPLHMALEADILVLPLPVCRTGGMNLPLTDTVLDPEQLWPRLRYDQLVLGGMTGELAPRIMADFGLTVIDYYAREELQVANAVPTAEGAIQRAMEATDGTLHGSRCLVLGFGRVGKLLAYRLRNLGAQVTVAARKYRDLAWIDALDFCSLPIGELSGHLGEFDLIFNTVPALLLDAPRLTETKENCLLMELASAPGGIEEGAAQRLGRRLIRAPGLPGIVAPRAAARAIRESIRHILEERGEPM